VKFAIDYLKDLNTALAGLDIPAIAQAIDWIKAARDAARTIYVCGNGGSASIASHMVVDMLKGASYGREHRFKIIGLTDCVETITAYGNDVNYECIFVEQIRNFAKKGDVLIAISGSGDSRNILSAVEYANSIGCRTIGMTRAGGGALKEMADLSLLVPDNHMGRLEDGFMVMAHIIAYAFMEHAVD
jgi:D-sedoheptulose 7-phosphate isomerase